MNYAIVMVLAFVVLGVASKRMNQRVYIIMGLLIIIYVYHAYRAG